MSSQLDQQPWGRAIGVLVASLVTLIGIARDVAPITLMTRVAIAALISAFIVNRFVSLVSELVKTDES